ncbi:MAG: CoA transferase [Dehalococcoidia bacterium]|nr:CoA transferase [Dehalococcoidia bacterium]MDW8120053.1 CaiB/BaiF CoA-transferase family protein [Chloroflexota bacterium]
MAGPLAGVRVVDLSWILSGPFCTMILADLGAEVVKVERPGTGDAARGTGPFVDGVSAYFLSLNRNKKSITLNLQHPYGKDLFLRLVEQADVLVENFTPGTMAHLGLGYDTLSQRNPRLIYCAISGFGQDGPYAQRPALDVIVQAMGGVMSITGEPNGPPVRPGTSYGDIVAGLFAAVGICSALYERQQSGKGQFLDISMLDCQVAVLENAIARYLATGEVPRPLGTRHPSATPFQAFPTKDGWIVVAIFGGNETHWPLFCAAIGHPEWIDDPRFQTSWSRTQHHHILEPAISEAMRQKTTQEWLDELLALGIPCGPVNTIDKVVQDPQIQHRKMLVELPHPRIGAWKYPNTPIRHSRTPGGVRTSAPDLGEHTAQVLAAWLGLTPPEVEALRREGVV